MQILVTGGTGFIGQHLAALLSGQGHTVVVWSRNRVGHDGPITYVRRLEDVAAPVEAVINLAGASLAARRWSKAYKAEIRASRIALTEQLITWMAQQKSPPSVLLSASATGFYGTDSNEPCSEDVQAGTGFAAELCADWEAIAEQAEAMGCRVVKLRLGVVLDASAGALPQMTQSWKFAVGSWLGSGKQWLSWIHLADAVAAINFLLVDTSAEGAFNLVAPEPVTHRELARACSRQKFTLASFGVPELPMRLMLGEMAEEILLRGQRAVPTKLLQAGFRFQFETLDDALHDLWG